MRLFIAVNFNENTRIQLISLREKLRLSSESGNFTSDDNLHLTLAFIGECNSKETDKIKSVMDTIIFNPFETVIEKLGTFSHNTLWWAGVCENKPLMDLQHEITHKLALCGFETDNRKYRPHITIGREVVTDTTPQKIEPFGETVKSIDLMKSERINGKLTYTAIYTKGTVKNDY